VNGTMLNGVKLAETSLLHPGDRITLGDSEVVFHSDETTSQFIAIDTDSHATNWPFRSMTMRKSAAARRRRSSQR